MLGASLTLQQFVAAALQWWSAIEMSSSHWKFPYQYDVISQPEARILF